MENIDLVFEEIEGSAVGCSALTTLSCWNTCKPGGKSSDISSWDECLDLEAGTLQY